MVTAAAAAARGAAARQRLTAPRLELDMLLAVLAVQALNMYNVMFCKFCTAKLSAGNAHGVAVEQECLVARRVVDHLQQVSAQNLHQVHLRQRIATLLI